MGMQIRNNKVPIARVELKQEGVWFDMFRGMDANGRLTNAHFIAGALFTPDNVGAYEMPLELRITSIFGETVTDEIDLPWGEFPLNSDADKANDPDTGYSAPYMGAAQ